MRESQDCRQETSGVGYGTIAASGGHVTAIASDYIVARGNTITGSIGIIFQWAQLHEDARQPRRPDVRGHEWRARVEPNFFKLPSEKAIAVANSMIQDSFRWFTGLVIERRRLPADRVLVLSDGRAYTGRQALQEKLIDAIGGEDQALEWLRKEKDFRDQSGHLEARGRGLFFRSRLRRASSVPRKGLSPLF